MQEAADLLKMIQPSDLKYPERYKGASREQGRKRTERDDEEPSAATSAGTEKNGTTTEEATEAPEAKKQKAEETKVEN